MNQMKKIVILTTALILLFSSIVFAGGDKNCGTVGTGSTGTTGDGDTTQNRAPLD
jgi:hypothetical protein